MKKKILEKKVSNNGPNDQSKDTVVFMTAYKSTDLSKKLLTLQKRKKAKDLLLEHHISSLLIGNSILTQNGSLELDSTFDSIKQSTSFKFSPKDKSKDLEGFSNDLEKMGWCISLLHSLKLLLDSDYYSISYFVNMESFLINIGTKMFQVDPIVFHMNDVTFINFELIDYATGYPLTKDDICGRNNNYNLIPITSFQFWGDDRPTPDNRKISDMIYDNIISFFETMLRGKYQFDQFSYVHNLFVITSSITNVTDYFLKVLGVKNLDVKLENLNTNGAFEYYSQEYLGVTLLKNGQNKRQAIFDVQILESLKMFVLLNQIINLDITNDLNDTINKQIYIEHSMLITHVPIDTLKAIKNIQQTESFKLRKEAIEFKISYLNLQNERRKSKNALLLNVLLYFLTFIGSIGTLQVLKDEMGWPFLPWLISISIFFGLLGLFWIYLERKK